MPLSMPFLPCDAGQTDGLTLHFQINAFKESKIRRFYKKVASLCLTSTTSVVQLSVAQALRAPFLVQVTGGWFVGLQAIIPVFNFKMLLTFTSDTLERLKCFTIAASQENISQSDWWGHPFQEEKMFNCVNAEKMRKRKVLSAIIISWRPRRISADGR